jgi:hypothetical protein
MMLLCDQQYNIVILYVEIKERSLVKALYFGRIGMQGLLVGRQDYISHGMLHTESTTYVLGMCKIIKWEGIWNQMY